ncbi:MAG: NADH-quinone oxidoreductase subunit M [Actinomycetota bacterium]|nr:NADH-quinone oxidoreductase subunit M [Actinomycetota bacterium]
MNLPYLPILTVLPLVGAAAVLSVPTGRGQLAKVIALGFSLIELVLAIVMCARFVAGGARFQFLESYSWIPQFGVRFGFGTDGIALVLIALVAVLTPVIVLASWFEAEPAGRPVKTFFALILSLQACTVGVFAATDLFLFYVFFEAMLVPMYFLIGSYGGPRRQYAAVKFFLYSLAGGLLMLAAVIALYVVSKHAHVNGGAGSFAFTDLVKLHISSGTQKWLFLGFFIAFAIKAPLVPFHTWLPDAGAEAPIGGAVFLVGVLDKVGTFGFLRWCLPLFPDASRYFAPWVLGLAVAGILYGALLAMGQNDLKRLVAYTSVAHFGFIALGVFAFTSQAGSGAVLYMVNHGLSTGALFLVVGFLIARRGSRLAGDFGGLHRATPLLSGAFLIAGLSALALPGTNSFISEFLVLLGTFTVNKPVAIVATTGMILAALYVLLMYQRTMHGPLNPTLPGMRDMTTREAWVLGPVLALVVALGVYPKPLLDVITPAINATMHDVGSHDPAPTVREAGK